MPTCAHKLVPETLLLAIPEIDVEHEAIFNLLASLKRCCLESNALDHAMAEELLGRLREHFATEERLAKAVDEDFSAHAKKHDELLHVVAQLLDKPSRGDGNVFSMLRYIEYWCERHISEEDKPFSECLRGAQIPARQRETSSH